MWRKMKEKITKVTALASIIVFFIVAFQIMIMISPFAFFFYFVFNSISNQPLYLDVKFDGC